MPVEMMMERVATFPVEERVAMADVLIESLNGVDSAVEAAWAAVAGRRLQELKAGKVRGVNAATVFARARRACRT